MAGTRAATCTGWRGTNASAEPRASSARVPLPGPAGSADTGFAPCLGDGPRGPAWAAPRVCAFWNVPAGHSEVGVRPACDSAEPRGLPGCRGPRRLRGVRGRRGEQPRRAGRAGNPAPRARARLPAPTRRAKRGAADPGDRDRDDRDCDGHIAPMAAGLAVRGAGRRGGGVANTAVVALLGHTLRTCIRAGPRAGRRQTPPCTT